MATYGFHSEAAEEYLAATQYYIDHASPLVAAVFVAEIDTAIQTLRSAPTRYAVIEEPQIRRFLLTRFPYSIYCRYEPNLNRLDLCSDAHEQVTGLLARSFKVKVGLPHPLTQVLLT